MNNNYECKTLKDDIYNLIKLAIKKTSLLDNDDKNDVLKSITVDINKILDDK